MDNSIIKSKNAIIKTKTIIKVEDNKIASYGCNAEQKEQVSDWALIIFLCGAIISFVCIYGLFLITGVL